MMCDRKGMDHKQLGGASFTACVCHPSIWSSVRVPPAFITTFRLRSKWCYSKTNVHAGPVNKRFDAPFNDEIYKMYSYKDRPIYRLTKRKQIGLRSTLPSEMEHPQP